MARGILVQRDCSRSLGIFDRNRKHRDNLAHVWCGQSAARNTGTLYWHNTIDQDGESPIHLGHGDPQVFVGVITLTGCYQLWWMFLNRAATAMESVQSMTMYLNAGFVGLIAILALIVLAESASKWYGYLILKRPYTSTEIFDGEGIRIPA